MFRFNREEILRLFLAQEITTAALAKRAGISFKAAALGIDPLKYLTDPTAEGSD